MGPQPEPDAGDDAEPLLVGIDLADAAGLAEICEYLRDWMAGASAEVAESLARFGAGPEARTLLLEELERMVDVLVRLVPAPSPTLPKAEAALGPGEALGLAGLLTDLAAQGWPTEAAAAAEMEANCRRWALRLVLVPGIIR